MKLSGLSLDTIYFEDYLSFLTEVLELDLEELTDVSMRLELEGSWLEISRRTSSISQNSTTHVEFSLKETEHKALRQKLSFFYYRKGPSRFLFSRNGESSSEVVDPDGRVWRFINDSCEANQAATVSQFM
jgi:hypothetical protein